MKTYEINDDYISKIIKKNKKYGGATIKGYRAPIDVNNIIKGVIYGSLIETILMIGLL